jgi:hypothetical protein
MCLSPLYHSTSRITLRRFIRSRACTTSLLSSTASRRSTVRAASRGYSPKMRLASSTARASVSWSGLFITARNSTKPGFKIGGGIFVPLWALRFFVSEAIATSRALCPQPRRGLQTPARLGPAPPEHGWRRGRISLRHTGARFMEHALEILAALFVVIAIAGFVVVRALLRGPREKREMRSVHSKRRPF